MFMEYGFPTRGICVQFAAALSRPAPQWMFCVTRNECGIDQRGILIAINTESPKCMKLREQAN